MQIVQFTEPLPVTNPACCNDAKTQCSRCANEALRRHLLSNPTANASDDDDVAAMTPPTMDYGHADVGIVQNAVGDDSEMEPAALDYRAVSRASGLWSN